MRWTALVLATCLSARQAAAEERPAFQALAPEAQQALLSWLAPRCVEPGGGGEASPLVREAPGVLAAALLEAWELGPTSDLVEARRQELTEELERRRDLLASEEASAALPAELREMEAQATKDASAFVAGGLARSFREWRAASLTGLGANCAHEARGFLEGLADAGEADQRLAAREALSLLDRCE